MLMLTELFVYIGFQRKMPSLEYVKLLEAIRASLGICGVTLILISFVIESSKPKLAALGLIVAVLAILAAILPPNFI